MEHVEVERTRMLHLSIGTVYVKSKDKDSDEPALSVKDSMLPSERLM